MTAKLLRRTTLVLLCLGLAQCTSNTTISPGTPTAFATLRLNAANGTGDSSFGPNKTIVTTAIDPTLFGFAAAVAIQPDNKIVVAGSNGLAGQGQVALVRYNSDGSLDTTFGAGTGIVRTSLSSPASATAIVIQPGDSKIVVAALVVASSSSSTVTTGIVTSIVLVRYNANGTLDDTTFGTNGIAAAAVIGSGLGTDICALLFQNGKFVIAGASHDLDGHIVLYRYDSAGALDTTFGVSGKTTTNLIPNASSTDRPVAMAAQSDGRIIVVTRSGDDQAVLRYSVDGIQDATFGGAAGGIVTTNIGGVNYANAVAIQDASGAPGNTDKIVVAGHANVTQNTSDISLVRYSKDGVLDTSGVAGTGFGTTGIVTTDISGQFDNALAVVLQDQSGAEPKILVAGNTGLNGFSQTVALRYNADGTADTAFGSAGIGQVFVPVIGPSNFASGNAVAVQPGLGIIITGYD